MSGYVRYPFATCVRSIVFTVAPEFGMGIKEVSIEAGGEVLSKFSFSESDVSEAESA